MMNDKEKQMFADFEIVNVVEILSQMTADNRQKLANLLMEKYPDAANALEFALYTADMEYNLSKEFA